MLIQSSTSYFIPNQSHDTNTRLSARKNETSAASQSVSQDSPKTIDFNNISRNELNHLVKSGTLNLSDVLIMFPEQGLNLNQDIRAQMNSVADEKVNIFNFIQERIEYQKSIGQSTDYLSDILQKMNTVQDAPSSASVDIYT